MFNYVILCFLIPAFFFLNFLCVRFQGKDFFYYKIMTFLKIFFGLGSEHENNQASQPSAFTCPPNKAQKDKEWMKVGSKWKCKVNTGHCCILCQMVVDQTFEGGGWLGGKKGRTQEAFNF